MRIEENGFPFRLSSFRSFIRGQNVPLEPGELAERERRRQIAIAHQEAIRQQLEERERRRMEEKQRRIQEEREEELRIEREQEIEMKRREMELKKLEEKQERERKRKEALQQALELAEKEAKSKKERLKNKNVNENVERSKSPVKEDNVIKNVLTNEDVELNNKPEQQKTNNEDICNNNAASIELNQESKCTNINKDNNAIEHVNDTSRLQPLSPFRDNIAVLLPAPLENLQGMQLAVLMPTAPASIPQSLPIAVPIALTNEATSPLTENRILTPSQYRTKQFRNSSTQTDFDYHRNEDQKYLREKFSGLEINEDSRMRKGRQVEERPKWGANRPPTRYLKQSEKDPVYQRRKLRQKMRQAKGSANSSDDSQTSPVTYRRKGYIEKRQRATWRRNDHMFARNVSVYQTEIIPLESDKEQIYYKSHSHRCCCQCLHGGELATPRSSARSYLPDCRD